MDGMLPLISVVNVSAAMFFQQAHKDLLGGVSVSVTYTLVNCKDEMKNATISSKCLRGFLVRFSGHLLFLLLPVGPYLVVMGNRRHAFEH